MGAEPGTGGDATAEFDIVVAGSGAAGMTAALTAAHLGATVVVLEKTEYFGGSTARSGGGIWAPGNAVLRRARVADTPELAREYLAFVAGDDVPADLRDALLEHCPAMLDLVLAKTPLRLQWVPGYADYYPEAPGGLAAGRSVEPVPFDGTVLGAELAHLNPPYLPAPPGVAVTQADYRWLTLGPRHPRAVLAGARVAARVARTRLLRQRVLSLGQALAAGLRAGLIDSAVPVWLGTPLTGLVVTDGRVAGVHVVRDGSPVVVRARRGVVITTGGFERNLPMREQYQQQPVSTAWTTGSAGNTGDGITAGIEAGAATGLMDDAWWGPSIPLPGGPYFCLAERSLPGCVLVNGAGQRFVNESRPVRRRRARHVRGEHGGQPAHPRLAGLRPAVPGPVRLRGPAAGPAVPAPLAGRGSGVPRAGPGRARRPRSAWSRRRWQRPSSGSTSSRAPAGMRNSAGATRRTTSYYGDPRVRPNPNLAPLAAAAVLRRQDRPGRPGYQGRPAHRCAVPGATA